MQNERIKSGVLVIGKRPTITDPVEARRVIAKDVLQRAKSARSHFHVAPKEERTWRGIVFDSRKEMLDYIGLWEQQQAGMISNLRRQVWYELKIGTFKLGRYRADHVYFDHTLQREIVADSKGKRTEIFIMKKNLMKLIYDIDVVEL